MTSSIESSLTAIEDLIVCQTDLQNTMLLYYANMCRSLEQPYIRFCIDNPFAYTEFDIDEILRGLALIVLKDTLSPQLSEQHYGDYSESRRNCFALWLCCVATPFDNQIYPRLQKIFSQLQKNRDKIPDEITNQILNSKFTDKEKNEFIMKCNYVPSFLKSYHSEMPDSESIQIFNILMDVHKSSGLLFPDTFIFDKDVKLAIALSHSVPVKIAQKLGKNIIDLDVVELLIAYKFCLMALFIVGHILKLDYQSLSAFVLLTLKQDMSRLVASTQLIDVFTQFTNDIDNPSMLNALEKIKREVHSYVITGEDKHIDNLLPLFLNFNKSGQG